MPVSVKHIRRHAGWELNALRASDILGSRFEKARVPSRGTPIYDINGTVLFYRMPLKRGRLYIGYTDIAAIWVFGETLLSVSTGLVWDESAIRTEAIALARKKYPRLKFNRIRLVAYSYPKIAIQYLSNTREVLMLEWKSWVEVPPVSSERRPMEPSNFERWSFIDEMQEDEKKSRLKQFQSRQKSWKIDELKSIDPFVIKRAVLDPSKIKFKLKETREIHYSPMTDDHHPCYELRGQQTPLWCVAASVEMLLNFYRYQYDQPRLAAEMDLGTCDHYNGLPYGDENKVVDTIEKLSSNTLNATSIASPAWSVYTTEIKANRPLISFVPGHSRTVAGYTSTRLHLPGQLPYKGLLVYDPSPPTTCALPKEGGVITQWENFNARTYRYAFTAELKHV